MEHHLNFIGKVYSELKRLEDCPLLEHENAPEATIEIFKEFHEAVKNVKPGDDMILLTWLHEADRTILTTRPRNNPNAEMTGVFSTRSPCKLPVIGPQAHTCRRSFGSRLRRQCLRLIHSPASSRFTIPR